MNTKNETKLTATERARELLKNKPKKVAGFTLIETLVVLGIVAIVITAIVMKAGSANNKAKAQNMISDVATMVADIKNAYSSSSNGYNGLDNQAAINLKVVSADLPINGANIKDQFPSGTVTIATDSSNDFFTIVYTNIPSDVCSQVITTIGGATFQSIKVNGSTTVYDAVAGTQLDPTVVGTACSQKQNIIEFAAS